MNKETFLENIKSLGIEITEKQLEQLDEYASFLLEYNNHTNLTAIKTYEEVLLKHFYDSLTIVKAFNLKKCDNLVDIGTGAGFPGMVLKIIYPHLHVLLIDSNNKKISFLQELINRLNIANVDAINMRSEEYARMHIDEYDVVTARAVTTLPVLTELCLPMVKTGGYFIPLKANCDEEINLSSNILKTLNGVIEEVISFELPIEDSHRTIIRIKKIGKTPPNYPRSYDKIKKALKKQVK